MSSAAVTPKRQTSRRAFTFRQKLAIRAISWAGATAIRLIGPTLRVAASWEDGVPRKMGEGPGIYSFWHRCVFPAAWICRELQARVITSESFDGEYIARIIDRLGFVAVRGSSSRGGVKALLSLRREVEQGRSVAFTIDGPRGPRYVTKPGPVFLARETGVPMSYFYIAAERAWVLKTWDAMIIPKPFSRVLGRVGRSIPVPPEGDTEAYRLELQTALEKAREFAEANVHKVGSAEFPVGSGIAR